MTVKILLKQVREARNVSQNKLAQLIGMSLQNVQRIEYGDAKSIPLDTLDKLCEALNCQPGDLLIRFPDGDNEQENLMIEQTIQKLSSTFLENENDSSQLRSNCCYVLKTIPPLPESA
jgi:putative transcriptional regulator